MIDLANVTAPPRRRPGTVCTVARIRATLDAANLAIFEGWLAEGRTAGWIADRLNAAGYPELVRDANLRYHIAGRCRCE